MSRYPSLVTIGAGILAWTAGRMIATDAIIHHVVWVRFGMDLDDGLLGILLSTCMTVVVVTAPSWRKYSMRASTVLNE